MSDLESLPNSTRKLCDLIETYRKKHGELPSLEWIAKLMCVSVSTLSDCFGAILEGYGIR